VPQTTLQSFPPDPLRPHPHAGWCGSSETPDQPPPTSYRPTTAVNAARAGAEPQHRPRSRACRPVRVNLVSINSYMNPHFIVDIAHFRGIMLVGNESLIRLSISPLGCRRATKRSGEGFWVEKPGQRPMGHFMFVSKLFGLLSSVRPQTSCRG